MSSVVDVKLRPVGNALGFILPSEIVRQERLRKGETVTVSIMPAGNFDYRSLLGIAKGAKPFTRQHGGRD